MPTGLPWASAACDSRGHRLAVQHTLLCVLALGTGAAPVVGIAHRVEPDYPDEGLLLSMGVFLLFGLCPGVGVPGQRALGRAASAAAGRQPDAPAVRQPGGGPFAQLHEHADRALYEAKACRRNQVEA